MAYKLCPNPRCGARAPASQRECKECETLLFNVAPIEDEQEAVEAPPAPVRSSKRAILIANAGFTHFEIAPGTIVGRAPQADIDLSSAPRGDSISRRHARFVFADGAWLIEILSDTNPSFLGTTRLQSGSPTPLQHGDTLTFGESSFTFEVSE